MKVYIGPNSKVSVNFYFTLHSIKFMQLSYIYHFAQLRAKKLY